MRIVGKVAVSVGAVLALLLLVILGAWLALPFVLKATVQSLAEKNGFESVVIDIDSINWDHATLHRIAFKTETGFGPLVVNLRQLKIRYQVAVFALSSISAASGDMAWYQERVKASDVVTGKKPTLPPVPPIEVGRMGIVLDTQWGRIMFNGELKLSHQEKGINLVLSNQRQSLDWLTNQEFAMLQLAIRSENQLVARINASEPLGASTDIEGYAHLHRLRNWSKGNQLVPEGLRSTLQDFSMDNGSLQLQGQLDSSIDGYKFRGHGWSEWNEWQQQDFVHGANLEYRVQTMDGDWQIQILPNSQISLSDVRWGDENASISVPKAAFAVEAKVLVAAADSDWQLTIDPFIARTSALEIYLDPDTQILTQQVDLQGTVWPSGSHSRVELRAAVSEPVLPSLAVTAKTLDATVKFDTDRELRAQGRFTARDARMVDWPETMSGLSVVGNFKSQDRNVVAEGDVQLNEQSVATWKVSPDPPTKTQLKSNFAAEVTTVWSHIRPLFGKNVESLSFSTGGLTGDVQVIWNGDSTGTLTINGSGISGRYQQADFKDLFVESISTNIFESDYKVRISAKQGHAASGIPLYDLITDLHWHNDKIEFIEAGFRALGGNFQISPTRIDLAGKGNRLIVNVSDMDFGQLLMQIDRQGLSGSGQITGTIPVVFVGEGIEIKDGELHSTVPGTLRYQSDTSGTPEIDNIALQALQDFHYENLKIWLDYQPAGDYQIRLRLEGRNPKLYNGYPIAFNLNLAGQLPGLLRAGLLSGDFSGEILKTIQSEKIVR